MTGSRKKCSHITKNWKSRLAAPQVTYIMHALSEKGMHVNTEVTTIEEAVDEIMKEI